ncbi:MAG: fumarylacetoacetate hydrolase family protein [Actinobacteria bacterium]|nr:fumarylacetoacetate hydrolase family protein [Actinomycetota bacterium]
MRIGTAIVDGDAMLVEERGSELVPIEGPPGGLREAIAAGAPLRAAAGAAPLFGAKLTVPLWPGKIVAIGLNYLDHVRESGVEVPKQPIVFTKFTTSLIGDGETVEVDRSVTERVDWEVELAVVVGRSMRRVPVEKALDHVFGYTVANDLSARDVQFGDGQWVRGKSLDGFCPLGPVVVTAEEVPDPQALHLCTRVNGEVVQDAPTGEMVFGVAELLSFCSHSFTLEPGDVLLSGTPWGCGEFMDPQRSLQDGDEVEVEVEGIGSLTNPVRDRK